MEDEVARNSGRWVGRPIRRLEDRRHLTGAATFVDDIAVPGVAHLAFVRSPHAAARIESVDVSAAQACDDVVAVLTREDFPELEPWIPALDRPEFVRTELVLLARDRVRHVGEAVAMVIAESPHAAEDAVEQVVVRYEPTEPVASIEAALAEGAPRVHEEGNVLLDVAFADDPELERVFDQAEVVVHGVFETGRVTALALEARACLARWDAREQRMLLHSSTQIPHIVRTTVAGILKLPEQRMRVIAPDVGGGFGQKCVVAREEALCCLAARATGRPVKWTEDRQENLVSGYAGHEQRLEASAAFDGEGRIIALDVDIRSDVGAYSTHPFTCGVEALMAAAEICGPYAVRHYRCRTRAIATNKAPMAPYRGVSRPQMVLTMERLIQKAARRLEIEATEVRRRSLVPRDEFPWTGRSGLVIDEGSYHESLERAEEAIQLPAFRATQRSAREEGRLLGIGFACFAERTGYGTEAFNERKMAVTPGYDTAIARMDPTAGVTVLVGTSGHGQGHLTTLAQVAADALGVEPERIEIRQGDTDATPYGWGTFASRSAVVSGGATRRASGALAAKIRRIAAHLLEAAADDLELVGGRVRVAGSGHDGVALEEVARVAYLEAQSLPADEDPGLDCVASFDPPGTFSNALHAAVVEIDPSTGAVEIKRYVVVEDCGVMINPAIVEGQVRGGVAQGIAAALYEQLVYSAEGQLQTASLVDYLVPTAAEVPEIEIHHLETPSKFSETGAKGMGEGGTMGAPACIASAINDALAHLDVEIDVLPITPERVRDAIRAATPSATARR
ncbi:MAG: xanthine dehydrogenase family protein molybdopterin-binding subunit [Solirubrobacterales bacterium]|nr:xanthine dehydrogenase family protein molybdopterin-binding subunit [Solirubrobacterales bacterium]